MINLYLLHDELSLSLSLLCSTSRQLLGASRDASVIDYEKTNYHQKHLQSLCTASLSFVLATCFATVRSMRDGRMFPDTKRRLYISAVSTFVRQQWRNTRSVSWNVFQSTKLKGEHEWHRIQRYWRTKAPIGPRPRLRMRPSPGADADTTVPAC